MYLANEVFWKHYYFYIVTEFSFIIQLSQNMSSVYHFLKVIVFFFTGITGMVNKSGTIEISSMPNYRNSTL